MILGKSFWRIWSKALGEKAGITDNEADLIAFVRTLIVLSYITTNCFIIAGVISWIKDKSEQTKNFRIIF